MRIEGARNDVREQYELVGAVRSDTSRRKLRSRRSRDLRLMPECRRLALWISPMLARNGRGMPVNLGAWGIEPKWDG